MSKKLTGVITAALIVGAMGTTFAASNPFSDVPSGHWSYQAVTKLAQAGVIEGYGDGTFKGDKSITRYEMAQMVAVAIQNRQKATAGQKEEIDKLQDSFSEDLAYAAGGNSTASHNTQPAGQIFDWRQGIKTK